MSAVAFVCLVVAAQSAAPRPSLSKGQSVTYSVQMTYTDAKESDVTTKQDWKLSYVSDGQRITGTRKLLGMVVDGQTIKLGKVDEEHWTEVRNSRGEVMARTILNDQDSAKRRWLRLFDVSYPPAALRRGSTWATVDEQDGVPRLQMRYAVEAIDDDSMTLKFTGSEVGNYGWSLAGELRCDKRTGWPLDIHGKAERVTLPDDEEKRMYNLAFTARRAAQ